MEKIERSVNASERVTKTFKIIGITYCHINLLGPWLIFDLAFISDKDPDGYPIIK